MIRASIVAVVLAGLATPRAHAQTIAITGGTVLPVSGPRIERRATASAADLPLSMKTSRRRRRSVAISAESRGRTERAAP